MELGAWIEFEIRGSSSLIRLEVIGGFKVVNFLDKMVISVDEHRLILDADYRLLPRDFFLRARVESI